MLTGACHGTWHVPGLGSGEGEGVGDTLSLGNSTTAGPIAFKFGV